MCVHSLVTYLFMMFPTAASISSISSLTGSDSVNFIDDDKRQQGI